MPAPSILITGASGYVGAHVARRLLQLGWQTHLVLRPQASTALLGDAQQHPALTCHRHDGSTEDMLRIMRTAAPAAVIHLASLVLTQHRPADVAPLVQANVLFGTQLLDSMAQCGVQLLVNTGTSWQHLNDQPYSPVCLYAALKQSFDAIVQFYQESAGLRVITLKLFDTYGPQDPRPKLLNLLTQAAQTQQPLAMSPGQQEIDLVHIDDVVAAYIVALERLRAGHVAAIEQYGISSGRPLTLRALTETIAAVAGKPLPIDWGGRAYRPREVMQAWRSHARLPGWQPQIDLATGLAALLDD